MACGKLSRYEQVVTATGSGHSGQCDSLMELRNWLSPSGALPVALSLCFLCEVQKVAEAFARRFLPSTKRDVNVKDENGRTLTVKWIPRSLMLSADWEAFAKKRCLKPGSVVLLQVSGGKESPRLKVQDCTAL